MPAKSSSIAASGSARSSQNITSAKYERSLAQALLPALRLVNLGHRRQGVGSGPHTVEPANALGSDRRVYELFAEHVLLELQVKPGQTGEQLLADRTILVSCLELPFHPRVAAQKVATRGV